MQQEGIPVSDFGFSSDNDYAILIYELWMLLRHQAVFDFGMPKALRFEIIFKILNLYDIPKHLHIWCFETLHYISSEIFSAMEETIAKESK